MLKIHNNLTRSKEEFRPIEPGRVRMYVCGMTVYDYCHLGHARVMVVFDVVARYLRALGYELTYVRNVTDVDDKIIARAKENREDITGLTERFIEAMHRDERALGVLPPDMEPRATQSMESIIAMIRKLAERGYAYVGESGDVYYSVAKFGGYGKLSGKNPEELRAGERVEVDPAKRDPFDFVLWKMTKPGEPAWDSPWGKGRPGWHIECSAMSTACLGNHFDIHGGGMDLQFPHHENEIAQSEGASGEKFVNVWMHNGFVRVNEEKMSKSLGNFFTVREVMKRYRPEAIRLFILSSHYRSPLNYTDEQLEEASASLDRLYTALRGLKPARGGGESGIRYRERFHEAMCDDFNTPLALSVLFDLAREINRHKSSDPETAVRLGGVLRESGGILGLLQAEPEAYFKQGEPREEAGLGDAAVAELIEKRLAARRNKDWALADRIRDQLRDQGIVLEDTPGGTHWRRA